MKRRTVIAKGGALLSVAALGTVPFVRRATAQSTQGPTYDWPISNLRSGGTAGLPAQLPTPTFRTEPQCIVTLNKILGPCHTNDVPVRHDITEGIAGLPMQISLRLVEATSCNPIKDADVEIWHADIRGVYSGRAAAMCNPGDGPAQNAGFLRGRQITDADGVANFLTIYPGWYGGRTPHVHLRILANGRELLITQLIYDDALNDLIYGRHPDYAGRPPRDTMNDGDMAFAAAEVERFIFDVEKLDIGILQASYTVGLAT
ncbi:protocatechuate 3,4-dioxygenase [Rhizobium leguminosarum]|uniref:dioxygenase family protein n=1 Tax=Rhizobium leguminosarum TaxID=384 RepID=UPI000FF5B241|nr:protocatechuate 3,4-dioxygenase [Rhizobium leguminosarum]RWY66172.1 protocatechuate 3,4-dioxygenase [Rhizobium leguminosarum]